MPSRLSWSDQEMWTRLGRPGLESLLQDVFQCFLVHRETLARIFPSFEGNSPRCRPVEPIADRRAWRRHFGPSRNLVMGASGSDGMRT
jgi:hypothetical protein